MEKFNKTIKRIAAFAGGAVMVGAALSGALAQLDKLPAPFVNAAGVFDSYVVVGTMGWNPDLKFDAAAAQGLASDVATGIEVGAAFAQKATTAVSTGTGAGTVSGGIQIKGSGDDFNYGDYAGTLKDTYGSDHLSVLADGTYVDSKGTKNTVGYTQTIKLDSNAGEAIFGVDKSKSTEPAGSYVKISKSNNVYDYTLRFDSSVDFNCGGSSSSDIVDNIVKDFKGTKITIQGKEYTISEATADSSTKKLTSLTLLAGAQEVTQAYQTTQTYTYKDKTFDVTINTIAQEGPNAASYIATLTVNGQTFTNLKEGDTFTVNGVDFGIKSVTYDVIVPTNSQVAFYIGADKIKLDANGGDVKFNDKTLDTYKITSQFTQGTCTSGVNKLDEIKITVKPKNDVYLHEGDSWVDPLFGTWKIMYTGLEKSSEMIEASVSGQDGSIKMKSYDHGVEVEIPVINDKTHNKVYWGDDLDWADSSQPAYLSDDGTGIPGALAIYNGATCSASSDITDCVGLKFMVVSSGGEMRIYEITSIDTTNDKMSVKDLSTDKEYTGIKMDGTAQYIGLINNFQVYYSGTDLILDNINDYTPTIVVTGTTKVDVQFKSLKGAEIGLYRKAADDLEVYIQDKATSPNKHYFSFDEDTNGDLEINNDDSNLANWYSVTKDSKIKMALDKTKWGTLFTYDTDGKDSLKIEYPEERVIFDAYVAPTSATVTTPTSGAVSVNYVTPGFAKTDADFASEVPTKNVILIGGPAVNELVKDLADGGLTLKASDYKPDTAIIQYIKGAFGGSKDALIIAGNEAKDTKIAGQVVEARLLYGQFADKLKGDKVTLNTAGITTYQGVKFA